MRERPEVEVGACGDAGRRDRLLPLAPRDEHRSPGPDDGRVLAVFEAGEQRVVLQCLVALLEVLDVLLAPHEAHVRNGVDELVGLGQHPVADQVRPELARDLELLVDLHGARDVDGAVGELGRVVELAEGGVAGAGVVPGVGALEGDIGEPLEDGDGPGRFQLLEQRSEGRAHDPAADQGDVDGLTHHPILGSRAGAHRREGCPRAAKIGDSCGAKDDGDLRQRSASAILPATESAGGAGDVPRSGSRFRWSKQPPAGTRTPTTRGSCGGGRAPPGRRRPRHEPPTKATPSASGADRRLRSGSDSSLWSGWRRRVSAVSWRWSASAASWWHRRVGEGLAQLAVHPVAPDRRGRSGGEPHRHVRGGMPYLPAKAPTSVNLAQTGSDVVRR